MSVRHEALRKLMEHFSPIRVGRRVVTSLEELTQVLGCTRRAAQLMLKRMGEEGWIAWQPGSGRGRFSSLIFLQSYEEMIRSEAHKLAAAGQWGLAWRLLQNEQVGESIREDFARFLASGSVGTTAPGEEKDVLRFVLYRPILSLDPGEAARRTEQHLVSQLFDTLLIYDTKAGCIKPHLAHGWDCKDGGKTYLFYLRKGVRFHDGREFTSEDVAYTMRRLAGGQAGAWMTALLETIVRIEAVTSHTLAIHLNEPLHALLDFLTLPGASIVPRGFTDGDRPVGTGPFRLIHKDDHKVELAAHAAYFGGRPFVDRVDMWILPAIYESGHATSSTEADRMAVNLQQYLYSEAPKEWIGQECTDRGCKLLVANLRDSDSNIVRRRTALISRLFSILDRKRMVNELGGNRYTAADSLTSTGIVNSRLTHDNDSAWQGIMNRASLTLAAGHGAGNERDAEWIRSEALSAGISVTVHYLSHGTLYQSTACPEADLILLEQPIGNDEEASLALIFHSPSSMLRRCYCKETEAYWHQLYQEKYIREPDKVKRRAHLQSMEDRLLQEQAVFPLYRWRQTAHYPPHVRNVAFDAYGWVDYRSIWFGTQPDFHTKK
ncbi:ABC transporter substrate-binding protein [Gorillibacterium sp. sgz5001074]|uniref:ABC transporter substrate-binding protein n=1 Tax=Gorillibacterium sp. sgz5001074 TaxID=3446695 RepID=UPI003F6772D1